MSPLAAVLALAVGLAVHAELLARLRVAEPAGPWWFGYARDGANTSAVLMLWGGYLLLGYHPPEALLAGMLTTLVTYLLDWVFARALKLKRPRLALAVPLTLWLAALTLWPRPIGLTIAGWIAANQPL
jgi:hypothetical protein